MVLEALEGSVFGITMQSNGFAPDSNWMHKDVNSERSLAAGMKSSSDMRGRGSRYALNRENSGKVRNSFRRQRDPAERSRDGFTEARRQDGRLGSYSGRATLTKECWRCDGVGA